MVITADCEGCDERLTFRVTSGEAVAYCDACDAWYHLKGGRQLRAGVSGPDGQSARQPGPAFS